MKFLDGQCTTALQHAGVFAWDLNRKRFVLSRASLCIAVFLLGSAPLSAGTQSVYVASGAGSFYDKPIQFKDHPSDTDYVCASSNAAGVWTSSMGRPCDYFLWANIPSTQSIATCDTSSGTCKNQNGGIETYVVKASISGSTPTPPVVVPPASSATADELVTWSACALTTTKDICVPIGYHIRWFGPQNGEAILGNVLTYTIKGLSNGFYSVTVASIDATGEGSTTNAAHFTINAGTPPVVPPPIPPGPVVTATGGSWTAKQGASNLKSGFKTHEDCWTYLGTQPAGKYSCAFSGETVTVKP